MLPDSWCDADPASNSFGSSILCCLPANLKPDPCQRGMPLGVTGEGSLAYRRCCGEMWCDISPGAPDRARMWAMMWFDAPLRRASSIDISGLYAPLSRGKMCNSDTGKIKGSSGLKPLPAGISPPRTWGQLSAGWRYMAWCCELATLSSRFSHQDPVQMPDGRYVDLGGTGWLQEAQDLPGRR